MNGHAPNRRQRLLVLGPPALWLALFFVLPFLMVLRMSLSDPASQQPPYRPVFEMAEGLPGLLALLAALDAENFRTLLTDSLYLDAFARSLRIAAGATLLTLLVGYPLAHAMARAPRGWQPVLVVMIILPFWTSFLIRVYAWIGILKPEGYLNHLLLSLGLIDAPLVILNTEIAIHIGIVYSYLPFMVLPIYAALEKQDASLLEAAADLGATPWRAFWQITVPLSLPGVAAGCLLVFIPSVGEFVIPDLLGGSETFMVGQALWAEFFANRDWPLASAFAVLLLAVVLLPILLFQRLEANRREGTAP
jgi:putrescine transport system permease protein